MSVLDQIKKLDEQKAALLSQAKQEALEAAHAAIKSLNELGFNYSLVQGEGTATVRAPRAPGTRRTGIREEVFNLINKSDGMARADVLKALEAQGDRKLEQSISNALAALKKDGKLAAENGVYTTV